MSVTLRDHDRRSERVFFALQPFCRDALFRHVLRCASGCERLHE